MDVDAGGEEDGQIEGRGREVREMGERDRQWARQGGQGSAVAGGVGGRGPSLRACKLASVGVG